MVTEELFSQIMGAELSRASNRLDIRVRIFEMPVPIFGHCSEAFFSIGHVTSCVVAGGLKQILPPNSTWYPLDATPTLFGQVFEICVSPLG